MQDSPHTRNRMVSLQMAGSVPHERTHAISEIDTRIRQRVGQLMCAIAGFKVGLPAHTGLGCCDDFFVRGDSGPTIQNVRHSKTAW